jgi:hypothetical protein
MSVDLMPLPLPLTLEMMPDELVATAIQKSNTASMLRMRCVSRRMQKLMEKAQLLFVYTMSLGKLCSLPIQMPYYEKRAGLVDDLVKKAAQFRLVFVSLHHVYLQTNARLANAFALGAHIETLLLIDVRLHPRAVDAIRNCQKLTTLRMSLNGLNSDDCACLLGPLGYENLVNLSLCNIGSVDDDAAALFATGLVRAKKLTDLTLCRIPNGALLGQALQNVPKLENVKFIRFGSAKLVLVLQGLVQSTGALKVLNLDTVKPARDEALEVANVEAIVVAVTKLTGLKQLYVIEMRFEQAIFEFAQKLPLLVKLQEVYLTNCGIDDEGAQALLSALPLCPRLKEIELNDNQISYPGLTGLRCVAQMHPNLRVVSVEDNHLYDVTWCEALAAALEGFGVELVY